MGKVVKYTTVEEVFAKIMADNDVGNESLRITDWVTWAGEALKRIGAFPQFVNRITGIEDGMYPTNVCKITGYRTTVPCDLHQIIQIAASSTVNGQWRPTRSATGSFDIQKGMKRSLQNSPTGLYPPSTDDKIQFVADVFNESYQNAFTRLNSTPTLEQIISTVFMNQAGPASANVNGLEDSEITYTENGPYLDFNIETGYAMIAYKALPTDENGYPLIPDVEEVKEAIYWYIEMKQLYPQWKNGKVRDAVYMHAKNEWGSKRLGAKGELMMPSGDELKSVMNSWLRLMPNINQDKTFFKYIGAQQQLYNQ